MDLKSVPSCHVFANTLFFLIAVLAISDGSIHTHHDQEALLAFKEKVVLDPFRSLTSWNSSVPLCQWYGVTCGHRHPTRVVTLNLQHQRLSGSLSPHIGNLSFLNVLNLANNSFSQNIPSQLGYLIRLRFLFLHNNSFEGEIPPNISACSRLVRFAAYNNKINGILPLELGSLSMLQFLALASNNLVGGIPDSYGNLSSLQELYLFGNSLSSKIPSSLGKLDKLQTLDFRLNNFSGVAPLSLFNISSLVQLDLSYNQLLGTLPQDLGKALPKLEFFSIRYNQFSGLLPVSLSNMSSLGYLSMGNNTFTGVVPNFSKLLNLYFLELSDSQFNRGKVGDLHFISSLINATELMALILENNGFVGRFSDSSFKNLSKRLQVFSVSGNKIYGNIPVWVSSYINLKALDLSGNRFSGIIPQEIGKLQRCEYLAFHQNRISGSIPSSFSNLTLLTDLYLHNNSLVNEIPSSLGGCQSLLYLNLADNNLTGLIPGEVFGVTSIVSLDLSANKLSGELPKEVGNLKSLVMLYIHRNRFKGDIPISLGSCVTLEFLVMEGNHFQGIIPSTFEALKSLEYLDLSNNNLSGQIPKFMKDLNLEFLNLSFNDLEGAIPEGGIFHNLSVISVSNNSKLCGGLPAQQLPKCISNKKHSSNFVSTTTFKLVISFVLGLLGVVIVLALILIFKSKRNPSIQNTNTNPNQLLMISFQELLKATNGFSESNLIGVGSYGSVYKGILDGNDLSIVAIKVLNTSHHGASKSFMAECDVLRNIRHRNLVKVLTACSGVDYNGNEFKALIYEFMINGNLDEWLHQNPQENINNSSKRLSFSQRLNISIDVANALDYLHNGCETSTIHCDLKPSNVLLDNELVAHVGDFGFARNLPQETQSSVVKGSIGYTAPGVGSYGSVYKGILDDDDRSVVAVKVLNLAIHGAFKSFMAECDVLRSIRHRNLVKVHTACSGVDYNCNEFKALIYEFMVNGNVDEWLHQNPQENDNSTSKRLSFSQRLNIAIDVANALDYLHYGCETATVHCDLKPSNVLLDNEMVAHVGDFGLARSLPQETRSSTVKGSIGYTAPEYGMGSKPSTHGDVYNFGILLLEMFTGKRPTNDMFRDLTDLHDHVKNALPGEVIEIVDPRILEDWEPNERRANTQENMRFSREAQKQIEGLISIFKLGVACSSYSVNERKNMKDVVQKLCSIRDVYTS